MCVCMITFACLQRKQRESGAGKKIFETEKREKRDDNDVRSSNILLRSG